MVSPEILNDVSFDTALSVANKLTVSRMSSYLTRSTCSWEKAFQANTDQHTEVNKTRHIFFFLYNSIVVIISAQDRQKIGRSQKSDQWNINQALLSWQTRFG